MGEQGSDIDDEVLEIYYALRRQHQDARSLRAHVLSLTETGRVSQRELARRLGVSSRTVNYWVSSARAERDEDSTLPPGRMPRRTQS